MAITINATVGSATANSFGTLEEATAYFDERLNADAWYTDSEKQKRALVMATRRLNRENWLGSRASTVQAPAWPRSDVPKIDAVSGYGAWEFGSTARDYYLTTEIPLEIKHAEFELALAYLEGWTEGADGVSEFSESGGVTVKFRQARPDGELPGAVVQLIAPLIAGAELARS